MITILKSATVGSENKISKVQFTFLFDIKSELPKDIYQVGSKAYIIAEDSIAVSNNTKTIYKYTNNSWIKTANKYSGNLTPISNITASGTYSFGDNYSEGMNSIKVVDNINGGGSKTNAFYPSVKTPSLMAQNDTGDKWLAKTWSGLYNFPGNSVWTDGDNIYCSLGSDHYVLDKETSTWSPKTWSGLTTFSGTDGIWTDGDNIYHSSNADNYVLDKSTSAWTIKIWNGLTDFYGSNVWTDGDNIYCSRGSDQYVLDKATSTWTPKTWSGLTNFGGGNVWTDGDNIYYSDLNNHYVLNKSTSTWSAKSWSGLTNFKGIKVWTDGDTIYYSDYSKQYVLDKTTSTWSVKTWSGLTQTTGEYIWTDGDNIYYSIGSGQYYLPITKKLFPKPIIKPEQLESDYHDYPSDDNGSGGR